MNSNSRSQPVLPVKTKYGVAAVTGASSGLGAEIAMAMASDAKALILIARSAHKLETVKKKILEKHPKLFVHTMVCDLSYSDDRYELIQKLSPLKIDTLILNAGSGVFKKFFEARYEDHEQTIAVNIMANVDLIYHLYPTLDREARVQIITSHSSGLRIPHFAVYAAAKTFLTTWAQTLILEQAPKDQRTLSIIAAGAMATEFGEHAGIPKMVSTPATPAEVAQQCLDRLGKSGTHFLSLYDRLIHWVNRILPDFLVNAIIARVQGKYLQQPAAPIIAPKKVDASVGAPSPQAAPSKFVVGAKPAEDAAKPRHPHGRRRRGNRGRGTAGAGGNKNGSRSSANPQ